MNWARNPALYASVAAILAAIGLEEYSTVAHHLLDVITGIVGIVGIVFAVKER